MAKKQELEKVEFDKSSLIKQLIKEQNAVSPESSMTGTNMTADVKIFIPTGSLILDHILSNKYDVGGWPVGRIIEVFGEESIGKSTLAYEGMKNTQKMGGICIFVDAENAGSLEMMRNCGVNTDEVIYSNENVMEKVYEGIEKNLITISQIPQMKGKPVFVVVDSISAFETMDEDDGNFEFNMNKSLKKAMLMGLALKKMAPLLHKANAVLYHVNQIRDKIGGYLGGSTTAGGKAIRFYSSIRLELAGKAAVTSPDPISEKAYNDAVIAFMKEKEEYDNLSKADKLLTTKPEKPKKGEYKSDGDVLIGYDITAKTVKNKIAPPKREAEFRIVFSEGVVDQYSWFEHCVKFGIIEKVTIQSNRITNLPEIPEFKRSEWIDILSDQSVYEYVKEAIIKSIVRESKGSDSLSYHEDETEDENLEE